MRVTAKTIESLCLKCRAKIASSRRPRGRPGKAPHDKIIELHNAGVSAAEIARQVGVCRTTVYLHLDQERERWL